MKKSNFIFLILAIIIGLSYTYIKSKNTYDIQTIQLGIADKIVRFHVIANSDSDADQALKLKVRDAVIDYISPKLNNSNDIETSIEILNSERKNIKNICDTVIAENGYSYPVKIQLCNTYFPTKSYGNYTFPPGTYRAFQIKIGEAKGHNWWCVLYPPLCFIDMSHGTVSNHSEDLLHEALTTDEFNAISGDSKVSFKFKYLTFLNKYIAPDK